jgi:hypothetical protein
VKTACQAAWYRLLTALTPRRSAAHARWREKKHRLRALTLAHTEASEWDQRIAEVLACPDLGRLPRHPQAGAIIGHDQVMHNGVRVALGSYYSRHAQRLLEASRGVHEPQEEWVFSEVLKHLPAGATMLELGAYWAFYSLWFQQQVSQARNFMVEPDQNNLNLGRLNFAINGYTGEFFRGYLGEHYRPNPDDAPVVSVDWLADQWKLERIHLLHSDIQGHELAMLRGADRLLRERRVDYIFVSTHSESLHVECRAFLRERGYALVAEHTVAESYAVDGLLVCRREELPGLDRVDISKKSAGS